MNSEYSSSSFHDNNNSGSKIDIKANDIINKFNVFDKENDSNLKEYYENFYA